MKKLVSLVVLFLGCTPDIPQESSQGRVVVAEFDPAAAAVPVPNDLAKDPTTGKIVVPPSATDSAAQREFDEKYLGTLDGFPFESTARAHFSGDLDAATITPRSVVAFDVTAQPAPVALAPRWEGATRSIVIPPPSGGWQRAHHYAIAVVGGPNGVRGAGGEDVIGSSAWSLVSSPTSLVTCSDLAAPDCAPTVDIIPSAEHDPERRLADQRAKAIALEKIRRGYAPLLDALGAQGIPRSAIPILWTFSIVDAAEVTFDPGANVVPFPNDALRVNGKVALPHPKTGQPLTPADCASTDPQVQLTCGLNTLDGFSTLVAPISETSDEGAALEQGMLDPASVNAMTVGLVPLRSDAPEVTRTKPKISPCVSCLSSSPNEPQQLQWKLDAPLDERTTYLAYATTALRDTTGKPVIPTPGLALLRSSAPLVENDRSAVDVLSDEEAKRLEPLRAALAPALTGLEAGGLPRTSLALAFAFTTQSEASTLEQLYAAPGMIPGLPADPTYVVDATTQYTTTAGAAGIPVDAIDKFYVGSFVTPVLVTGTGGTLDPTKPRPLPVSFVMAVPSTPAPPGGRPVTIFGHGFTRSRNDFLAIANALAQAGQVIVASDVIFHGERTSCTGSSAATKQASDDAACADPATQKCNGDPIVGRCVARSDASRDPCTPGPAGDATCGAAGQGACVAADAKCEGGDLLRDASGRPTISGWNMFSLTNFFATRDNFRQQVVDLAQLVRILGSAAFGTSGIPIDKTKIHYVGQSLGGILGTLFNAVSPSTSHVALNVAGGTLPNIILTAPSFAAQKAALLEGLAAQGIQPGTPAFDRFIGVVQWILDPADPANMAYRLTHPPAPPPERRAFLQFIEGDETVPNGPNLALVMAANRDFVPTPPSFGCVAPLFCYELTEQGESFDATSATPSTRHGFLLSPPQGTKGTALTAKAQTQVATFIATGGLQ